MGQTFHGFVIGLHHVGGAPDGLLLFDIPNLGRGVRSWFSGGGWLDHCFILPFLLFLLLFALFLLGVCLHHIEEVLERRVDGVKLRDVGFQQVTEDSTTFCGGHFLDDAVLKGHEDLGAHILDARRERRVV